ncbi:MAG TPA: sugar ABC transporter substrate-binding protein [Firmicutes bacterium]|nr:sugar ABC transporter substrate-binding protein [Bacillota bacterium]
MRTYWNLIICLATALALMLSVSAGVSAGITLTMTMWGNQPQKELFDKLAAEFAESDPEVDRIVITQISTQYRDKLAVMVAGGTPPDIMLLDSFNSKEAFAAGWTLDLEPLLARGEIDVDDFFEPFWDGVMYNGHRYGLPIWGGGFRTDVYAINKQLFDNYGLQQPRPTANPDQAWTFAEFINAVRTLTQDLNGDNRPDQFGYVPGRWFSWVFSNGGSILSEDRRKCVLDQPEAYSAIQMLGDLQNVYHVTSVAANFYSGRVGVLSTLYPNVALLRQQISRGGDFDWYLAHQPQGVAGSVGYAKMNVISIAKSTPHMEAAWRFVKFFTGRHAAEVMTTNYVSAPWLKSVAFSTRFITSSEPPYDMSPNVFGNSRPLPLVINWNGIAAVWDKAVQEINSGNVPAQSALYDACRQINAILDETAAKTAGPLY